MINCMVCRKYRHEAETASKNYRNQGFKAVVKKCDICNGWWIKLRKNDEKL